MAAGKYEAPKAAKRISARAVALVLVCVLALSGVVGGTMAWLIDVPDPVVNTFTYGDISISLDETDTGLDGDGKDTTNEYEMIPGQTITKDPVVTVKAGSEDMWLFVKLEKSDNFDDFMTYEVDGSWAALENAEGVYYRHITAAEVAETDMKIHVLQNDTVTVKEEVTKEQLNALDKNADGTEAETKTYPTLKVTAYAVQSAGSAAAADAWAKVTADNTANP